MISFIYSSCRKNSCIEWFLNGLYDQAKELNVDTSLFQIIYIDFHLQYDETRIETFQNLIKDKFNDFVHVSSKPSPYQGKYKITKHECFCAGLARNTGVCYAKNNYLVFVDDLAAMGPNNLKYIMDYARNNLIVAYSFKKVKQLKYENKNVFFEEVLSGIDPRIGQLPGKFREMDGGQFYGHGGMPLSVALQFNGYDEIHNAIGAEDSNLGLRIKKYHKLYFSEDVIFYESMEESAKENFLRIGFYMDQTSYYNLMNRYKIPRRWKHDADYHNSWFLLDLIMLETSWTQGNDYTLSDLRTKILSGGEFDKDFDVNMKTFWDEKLIDLNDQITGNEIKKID